MYSTLIVDDEDVIKIGLKTIVDWEELGYKIAGTAGNGLEALEMTEVIRPDLIITDILMPKMNGIEFMEALKERGYKGKIVVLSNYGEIDYVKTAMKLGAEDYILKVSYSREEFTELLKKMKPLLGTQTAKTDGIEIKSTEQSADSFYQIFLIVLPCFVKQLQEAEYEKICHKVRVVMGEILGNRSGLSISFIQKNKVAVSFSTGAERLADDTSIPAKIEKTLSLYLMLKSSVIYSLNNRGGENKQAAMDRCFEKSAALFYGTLTLEESRIRLEKISDIFDLITVTNRYRRYVKERMLEKMQDEIQSVVLNFREKMADPYEVKDFIRQIIIAVQLYFDEVYKTEVLKGYRSRVHECEDIAELHDLINSSMDEINARVTELSLQKEDYEVTENIKRYIQKNIDTKLTLNDVAQFAGFNPNYLSTFFKQKTGQTLSYYINDQKMKYAQKLLETGSYKVKEVSERVGYDDAFYFSRCFKKYFGYSPKNISKNGISEIM